MSLGEILMVIAIILAPVTALQISEYLAKTREKRRRRLDLFRSLMTTRASRTSREHILALNKIDVEFYGKDRKAKDVVEAWRIYLDHLYDPEVQSSPGTWLSKKDDLFVELLHKMALCLNYDFDRPSIKKVFYSPVAVGEKEQEETTIRKGLAKLFSGKFVIPVSLKKGDTSILDKIMGES